MDLLSQLNVKSLELLQSLDDDQRNIAAKVIAESLKQGVNPNFTLPLVKQESNFKQNAVSKAGATGVMQLMPDTASGLKVDPSDTDQNISGGIRLIKELSSNKMIGNDPIKILAGYNASTETRKKFLETGDPSVLPVETLEYITKVAGHGGDALPPVNFEPVTTQEDEDKANAKELQFPQPVIQDRAAQFGDTSPEVQAIIYGGAGHSIGTGVGAAKVGALKAAKKVYDWVHDPNAKLPYQQIEPVMGGAPVESVVKKQPVTQPSSATHGGENWVKSLTGVDVPGGQMKKADLDLAKGMQAAVGRSGERGFVGGQITPGGVIISPQDAFAIEKRMALQQAAQQRQSGVNERLQQVLQRKASAPAQVEPTTGGPLNLKARAANALNVTNLGSAGMGLGMAIPSAIAEYAKGEEGHPGTTLALGAGFGALSSMFPRAAPVVGSGLGALDAYNRVRNEDYVGAGLSALGTVGPLAAATLLAPPVGVPLAVGSALIPAAINAYRDYTNYVPPKKAGAGRGFVNPPLVQP